jgi:hypothetical protein
MLPIRLTDPQLTEIFRLMTPLQPALRNEFLERLAQAFQGRQEVGDGELYRICRQIIADNHLFQAPTTFEVSERGRRRGVSA